MRVTAAAPLNRILPPATEARTVEGGRLPGLIGAEAGVKGGAAGDSTTGLALMVLMVPVRCAGRCGRPLLTVASAGGANGRSGYRADGPGAGSRRVRQPGVVLVGDLEERSFDFPDVLLGDLIGPGGESRAHLLDELLERERDLGVLGVRHRAGKNFGALGIDRGEGHAGLAPGEIGVKLRRAEGHDAAPVERTLLEKSGRDAVDEIADFQADGDIRRFEHGGRGGRGDRLPGRRRRGNGSDRRHRCRGRAGGHGEGDLANRRAHGHVACHRGLGAGGRGAARWDGAG